MSELTDLREAVYAKRPGESVSIPDLPNGFEPTLWGTPLWIAHPGATGQFRGPDAMHAYRVDDGYKVHRDRFDPKENPVGHFFADAPELAIATGLAAVTAIWSYKAIEEWDAEKTDQDGSERPAWVRALIAVGVFIAVFIIVYAIGALIRVALSPG